MKRIMSKLSLVALAAAAWLMFSAFNLGGGLTDSRDGKSYKTVKIGDKVWMAENLNFDYNHGSAKSACYENKLENCAKNGRLYTWSAAMDSAAIFSKDGARCGDHGDCSAIGTIRGVCPEGWHLPSREEFYELSNIAGQAVGDKYKAGLALKSKLGWNKNGEKSGNGVDALGFSALAAGNYYGDGDYVYAEGKVASFWSSTEIASIAAVLLFLHHDSEYAGVYDDNKYFGFSVRCVKN